jgi:hypothetical protein
MHDGPILPCCTDAAVVMFAAAVIRSLVMLLDLLHHVAGGRCLCTWCILAHDCPSGLLITQWLVLLYGIVTSPDKGLCCLRVEPLMLTS